MDVFEKTYQVTTFIC